MDIERLRRTGIQPKNPRKGYLEGYALEIGERATLVRSAQARAYGLVMTLGSDALHRLYSESSVKDYIPESVTVISDTGLISAVCYNLPREVLSGSNSSYASQLLELARELKFPETYLERIQTMT